MTKKIATVELTANEASQVAAWGKIVNVYDSYARAISNGDTGLTPVYAVDRITGAIASGATTQRGKNTTNALGQTGLQIDEFGKFIFAVDTATAPIVYLNSACGMQGGVRKVVVCTADIPAEEESSSFVEESSSVVEESSSSSPVRPEESSSSVSESSSVPAEESSSSPEESGSSSS